MREIRILQEHVRISDPHITSDDVDRLSILGNVFEPLMRPRFDGTFESCLASSWMLSDDARTWTFHLNDDARWANGVPLKADDVVFSLRRMRDEDLPGELGTSGVISGYLAGSSIDMSGPGVVTLSTPEPMADLADLLCGIPILSESGEGELTAGTGRFRVVEATEGRTVLESRTTRLVFTAERNEEARFQAFLDGKADLASKLRTIRAGSPGVVRSTTSVCATFMFNLFSETAKNAALRKAVNLAVDVDALIEDVMHGAADPLTGPLTSRHLGFDPRVRSWPYDPPAARLELKTGGVPEGTHVGMDIPRVLPDEAPILAKAIAGYLEAVGLKAVIQTEEDRTRYANRVRNKEIGDIACFDSSPSSTFRVFREKFHSGCAGPWWLGYRNPAFDKLVDEAQSTTGIEKRRDLYRAAYAMLRNDAPWLFLYNPVGLTGVGNNMMNWTPSTGGLLLFR